MPREPAAIRAVFPDLDDDVVEAVQSGSAEVAVEYPIGDGYADLAIVSDRTVLAIAETKQADIIGQRVAGQLQGYRKFVKASGRSVHFSLITMHSPDEEHMRVLRLSWGKGQRNVVRFHHIAAALQPHAERPMVALLLEYMREQRMTGYQRIDGKASTLPLLMTRFLPVQHSHGLGRLQSARSVQSVAELLDALLRNTQYMADWFRADNTDLFPRTFASEFSARPWFNYKKLGRYLNKNQKTEDEALPRNQCVGGSLDVYVQGRLAASSISAPKGHDINIYLGYWVELNLGAKRKIQPYLYVGTSGNKAFREKYRDFRDAWITCDLSWEQDTIRKKLRLLARKAMKRAANNAVSPRLEKALRSINFSGY